MNHRTARRALAALAVATTITTTGLTAAPAGAVPGADARLEHLCEARGGSFHINRYGGTNLICSAALDGGHEFRPERAACEELAGSWAQTDALEGRRSWFCRRVQS